MSRWIASALLCCLAALSLSCTPPEPETKRLIFLTNGQSPFWDACRAGMKAAEKELKLNEKGYQVVMEVNDGSLQGQISKLRQYATQRDIVAIAVSPTDAENAALAEEMKKLRDKGIHVICTDNDVADKEARQFYIGTENVTAGKVLGIAAREMLKAKGVESGRYACFVGLSGSKNAIERMDGIAESIGDSYEEADRMADNFDKAKARSNVRQAMTNFPDLKALAGIWSYNAPAIVDVVKERNNRDEFVIVVFDAEPLAIQALGAGDIDAMIVQNPYQMGYDSMRVLWALDSDQEDVVDEMFPERKFPPQDIRYTGLKLVVPNADSPIQAEAFDQFGDQLEYLTLPEFQKWLDKYGLKQS